MISALVIGANPEVNVVKFGNGKFYWAGLLALFALPLFFVFFRRLARLLERPDLERRARSILKLMAWGLALMVTVVPSFNLASFMIVFQLGAALCAMVLGPLILFHSFRLVRGLQTEITRRL
jgi:hypothetical protein